MSKIPAELDAEMTPAVRAFVESLLERIAQLEARLNMTPHNSSVPPSSQHPQAKPAPARSKAKRKRGGQPGHQKHERALVPPEQVDETVVLKPAAGRRCGERLTGADPEPLRQARTRRRPAREEAGGVRGSRNGAAGDQTEHH